MMMAVASDLPALENQAEFKRAAELDRCSPTGKDERASSRR